MLPRRYGNLSGDSGVTKFALGSGFIAVQFREATVYVYDWSRPGRSHVEQMTVHAIAGRGLGTYISQHVKKVYARKQRSW
jgi:hypothetical protein